MSTKQSFTSLTSRLQNSYPPTIRPTNTIHHLPRRRLFSTTTSISFQRFSRCNNSIPLPITKRTELNKIPSNKSNILKSRPSSTSSSPSSPKIYTFSEIQKLTNNPSSDRILIDVREPGELKSTGTIPTSINIPLTSSPDAYFLSAEEFEDKFGFQRPDLNTEVIFFCKSGIRSQAASRLAEKGDFGGKKGEYKGSWKDWELNGGEIQKV